MELPEALEFVRSTHAGVLVTLKRDGRPQLSNISYAVTDGDLIRISITDDRAKTKNLRRDPRASLYVGRPDFSAYVVVEGTVELSAVSTEPGDAAGQELIELFREVQGKEHPDWDEYNAAMVNDRRLVARLHPERAYGFVMR